MNAVGLGQMPPLYYVFVVGGLGNWSDAAFLMSGHEQSKRWRTESEARALVASLNYPGPGNPLAGSPTAAYRWDGGTSATWLAPWPCPPYPVMPQYGAPPSPQQVAAGEAAYQKALAAYKASLDQGCPPQAPPKPGPPVE